MRHKYFYHAILTLAFMLAWGIAANAQSGPLRGIVVMMGADGKETPVAEAQIDVYRTDLPGKFNTKTNKKGEFVFAGVPFVGTYAIAVSAPNVAPTVLPNIRPGENENKVVVSAGDGRRLTENEAKTMAKGSTATPGGGKSGGESADDKRAREEYEKKKVEVEEKNKKITEVNAVMQKSFQTGNEAFNQAEALRNSDRAKAIQFYNTAIAAYTEGISADPEHPGAPVLLLNRGLAQKAVGVQYYNLYVMAKGDDPSRAENQATARKNFKDSVASFNQCLETLSKMQAEEPTAQANNANNKMSALNARTEAYYFHITKGDPLESGNDVEKAYAAFQEYMAAETDPAKKANAQAKLALMLFEYNLFDRALAEYQKVLAVNPDDPDALVRSGMALFNIGAMSGDKTKYQEAANYLQRFVEKAPDTHQFKQDAVAILDNLKKEQNVKPEKATPTRRRP